MTPSDDPSDLILGDLETTSDQITQECFELLAVRFKRFEEGLVEAFPLLDEFLQVTFEASDHPALSDPSLFHDRTHLDRNGAALFSRKLAEALAS